MDKRLKKLALAAAVVIGGAVGVGINIFDYSRNKTAFPDDTRPKFRNVLGRYVGFTDDFAPGMRAYSVQHGREIEMKPKSYNSRYAMFEIPSKALSENGRIEFYAVDKDGKRSDITELFLCNK